MNIIASLRELSSTSKEFSQLFADISNNLSGSIKTADDLSSRIITFVDAEKRLLSGLLDELKADTSTLQIPANIKEASIINIKELLVSRNVLAASLLYIVSDKTNSIRVFRSIFDDKGATFGVLPEVIRWYLFYGPGVEYALSQDNSVDVLNEIAERVLQNLSGYQPAIELLRIYVQAFRAAACDKVVEGLLAFQEGYKAGSLLVNESLSDYYIRSYSRLADCYKKLNMLDKELHAREQWEDVYAIKILGKNSLAVLSENLEKTTPSLQKAISDHYRRKGFIFALLDKPDDALANYRVIPEQLRSAEDFSLIDRISAIKRGKKEYCLVTSDYFNYASKSDLVKLREAIYALMRKHVGRSIILQERSSLPNDVFRHGLDGQFTENDMKNLSQYIRKSGDRLIDTEICATLNSDMHNSTKVPLLLCRVGQIGNYALGVQIIPISGNKVDIHYLYLWPLNNFPINDEELQSLQGAIKRTPNEIENLNLSIKSNLIVLSEHIRSYFKYEIDAQVSLSKTAPSIDKQLSGGSYKKILDEIDSKEKKGPIEIENISESDEDY